MQLLAHGLQVNPKNKELCGTDEDGLFSVVMANRLASKADTKYHACLVSYEGLFDKLPTNATYITESDPITNEIEKGESSKFGVSVRPSGNLLRCKRHQVTVVLEQM